MSQHVHLPKFPCSQYRVFNKVYRQHENINYKSKCEKMIITKGEETMWLSKGKKCTSQTSRGWGVGGLGDNSEKIFHFENVQDLMQLPLSHSLSLLSVGAKSHVSTASGCVDSFTNRNVKRHTQGGLRDKGELNGAGNRTNMAQRSTEWLVKTPWLGYFNYIEFTTLSAIAMSGVGIWRGSTAAWYRWDFL